MKSVIFHKTALTALLAVSMAFGFKTFTEKVNPFNRFLNPVDGVDLYSGNAAFTKTLYTMKGRNGLDIGINLKYSSNVYVNVRARNDVAPTGPLGLGWNLSYGSIRSDHKGTRNPADDDFFWESPEGYSKRLFVEFTLNDSLLPTGNANCGIEEMPYVKVICVYDSVNRLIKGWKIRKTDGSTLSYGDLFSDATRAATRYTFACGNYIEPAINPARDSLYSLYPCQWDLSDISDNFGNHIVFRYAQDTEHIKAKSWVPPQDTFYTTRYAYTKASYIKTILSPEGKRIEFGLVPKDSNEYYDPYKFGPEPDAFIEKIERKLFDTINIYNANGKLIKHFEFRYKKINEKLPPNFLKSLLTEIREYGGNNLLYNKDVFTYYDDFAKGDEDSTGKYDEDYNYGGLETHKDMKGYVVRYEYARAELIATKTKSDNHQMPPGFMDWRGDISIGRRSANAYPFGVITTTQKCCCYTWNGGSWEFQDLTDSVPNVLKTESCDTNMIAAAGNDYFVLLGGKITESRKFCVFIWDEEREKWLLDKSVDSANHFTGIYNVNNPPLSCVSGNNYFSDVRVFAAPDYFLLVDGNRDGNSTSHVLSWNKLKNGKLRWRMNAVGSFTKMYNFDYKVPLIVNIAENKFAVRGLAADYYLFNWDGTKWVDSAIHEPGVLQDDPFYYARMQINTNNFNFYYQYAPGAYTFPRQRLNRWDGNRWIKVYDSLDWRVKKDFNSLDYNHMVRFIPKAISDPYYSGGSWDFLSWNGNNWQSTVSKAILLPVDNDLNEIAAFVHENYSICVLVKVLPQGIECTKHYRLEWKTNDKMWQFQQSPFPQDSGKYTFHNSAAWPSSGTGIYKWPHCIMENDFFVSYSIQESNASKWDASIDKHFPVKADVIVWNGAKWSYPFGASTNTMLWNYVMDVKTTSDAVMLLHRNLSDTSLHSRATVTLYHKFQNSFNDTIYTYTLSQKTFTPGYGQSTERVTYFYDTCTTPPNCRGDTSRGNYDTRTGSARFNKVEVRLANNAKKIVYYYNHTANDGQDAGNPDYKRLDGLTYRSENTDSSGVKLLPTCDTTVYQVYKDTSWLTGVYDRRVTGSISRLDRVRTNIRSDYRLNAGAADINGMPRYRYVRNSDGDTIWEYTLFAHERPEYATMAGDPNILDQPCLKLVLENWTPAAVPASTWYGSIGKTNIRKATAITWAVNNNPAGIWAPAGVYVWNVRRNNSGIPDSNFTGFNFANPAARSNAWEFVSAITRYNRYGQVLESRKPVSGNPDLYSATYYRDDMALPVASALNVKYDGASVNTCDREETLVLLHPVSGYADTTGIRGLYLGNGWFKPVVITGQCNWSVTGTCEVTGSKRHFGQRCIYVKNSPGPTTHLYGGEIWNGNLNRVYRDSAYVRVDPARNYVFSAWINPKAGDPIAFTVDVYKNRVRQGAIVNTTASLGLSQNAWSLVSFPVSFSGYPALDPNNPDDGVELTIGRTGDSAAVNFYMDDIRFYPRDAFVTTTYYDTLWEKPVVSVDANNAPGAKAAAMSKQEMLENRITSHDAEGTISNFTGRIGADALGTNIYFDEIWQKPKVLMRDDPAGRIVYDEHGREKCWYKMAYKGPEGAPDTLILKKKYNMSGIRP